MARLVLFDRGENGGLLVEDHGVRPVAALAPSLLAHLRAVSEMLRAAEGSSLGPAMAADFSPLITRVCNLAIERIEGAYGKLDADDALTYISDDDGFICGSTGAPPRPIKWPPPPPDIEGLIGNGVLPADLPEFLAATKKNGLDLFDVIENPNGAAERINFKLSQLAADSLRQVAPSQTHSIVDPVDRGAVEFFHTVVRDGRFMDTWASEPVAVSKSLGVTLDNAVVDRLLGSNAAIEGAQRVANLSIEQGIVVGIVAIIVLAKDPEQAVMDRSGIEKF